MRLLSDSTVNVHVRRQVYQLLARTAESAEWLVELLLGFIDSERESIPRCDLVFIEDLLTATAGYEHRELRSRIYRHMPNVPDPLFALPAHLKGSYWCDVPAGRCVIGANLADPEKPGWVPDAFEVDVPGFQIGRVTITNVAYEKFDPAHIAQRSTANQPPDEPTDHHPAVEVSWFEAEAFSRWASAKFPGLRLPFEIEWEKSASWNGRENYKYPWGNSWNSALLNSWRGGPNRITAVGTYPDGASPYGAYDMAGNVWEWCVDWFSEDLKALAVEGGFRTPSDGERRVDRGGSWLQDSGVVAAPAMYMRAADDPSDRFPHCGFRLVLPIAAA
jgi:formylglycine-generating enzyme required for sulfatase activity